MAMSTIRVVLRENDVPDPYTLGRGLLRRLRQIPIPASWLDGGGARGYPCTPRRSGSGSARPEGRELVLCRANEKPPVAADALTK